MAAQSPLDKIRAQQALKPIVAPKVDKAPHPQFVPFSVNLKLRDAKLRAAIGAQALPGEHAHQTILRLLTVNLLR